MTDQMARSDEAALTANAASTDGGLDGGQIVFIDGALPDAASLAAGVRPGVQAVILDPAQDGIQQIASFLASRGGRKLGSIAIVSHGANGMMQLGTTFLDSASIALYAPELAAIGAALDAGGDLMLFGCDVAQSASGVAFVHALSDAMGGIDIAAASHLVGAADQGGSFNLDVNTGAIEAVTPFTPATQAAFSSVLPTTVNQIYFSTQGAPSPFAANGIRSVGVSTTASVGSETVLRSGDQETLTNLPNVVVDPATHKYFVVNSNANTVNKILQGDVLNPGSLTAVVTLPAQAPITHQIVGLAIDQPTQTLYYVVDANAANTGSIGVWKVSESGGTPTQVIGNIAAGTTVFTAANIPTNVALDLSNNLVFFTEGGGIAATTTRLWVGNTVSGTASVLTTSTKGLPFRGVAVNNGTVYYTIANGATAANNLILAAPYTVSGSGATTTASLGTVSTLYAGANAGNPQTIVIDPSTGLLYTDGSINNGTFSTAVLNVGTITATNSTAVQNVFTLSNGTNGVTGQGIFLEVAPTLTASGTTTFNQSGGAVSLLPQAKVTSPSGNTLASATVAVTTGSFSNDGDTLTAVTTGTSITAIFSGDTLTLSGIDTAAHYQQVLNTVAFNNSNSDPTNGGTSTTRSVNWTVSDGIISSASPTSQVTINGSPTITAASSASFTGGGSAITLSPALTVFDPSGPSLTGATVTLSGGLSGDQLNYTAINGITGSYSTGTGVLSLSGTTTAANYQAALRTITYSFTPSNGDPTAGNKDTSRTITWSITDGLAPSNTPSTTLTVIHAAPTISVAGNVSFAAGGGAVVLDSAATVTAPDSLDQLSKATITIDGGLLPGDGDVLSANVTGTSISVSYNSGTEVLTLSGADTTAHYQQVLRTVAISTSSGDPTGGGLHTSRTLSWVVNDGVVDSAADTTTATALCFLAGTRIMTPDGEVQVQDLRQGDMVVTASGKSRPLVWIGHGTVLATRGQRGPATPVIVRQGAFGDRTPHHDLRVTKGHAFHIDGVLIPVEFLINHRSIIWDDHAQEVSLYHLELDSHDVLLANGAPAESYRDDGNRWLFHNTNAGWGMPMHPPCAPLLTGGEPVDAIWRRLLALAGPAANPPLTDDPDLHAMVGGRRFDPLWVRDGRVAFRLPAGATDVRIMSRDAIPAELGFAREFRSLGVSVRRMVLTAGSTVRVIEADDRRLSDGFHLFEAQDAIRWTNGSATLPASLFDGMAGRMELVLHLGPAMRYLDDGAVRRSA